jgi:hypothetical protein
MIGRPQMTLLVCRSTPLQVAETPLPSTSPPRLRTRRIRCSEPLRTLSPSGATPRELRGHRWKLVPRWLTTWGFLGAALTLAASFMVLLGLADIVTPLYLSLNAPLAAQSLALALWLIARGLDTTSLEVELIEQAVV